MKDQKFDIPRTVLITSAKGIVYADGIRSISVHHIDQRNLTVLVLEGSEEDAMSRNLISHIISSASMKNGKVLHFDIASKGRWVPLGYVTLLATKHHKSAFTVLTTKVEKETKRMFIQVRDKDGAACAGVVQVTEYPDAKVYEISK